jgi:hypothetical protein
MHDPHEHGLVVKALKDGLGNCVVWHMRCADRLLNDSDLQGYTLPFIRKQLIAHVRQHGDSVVEQIPETRPNWLDQYSYYYKVILPLGGFKHGLFVEMRLADY